MKELTAASDSVASFSDHPSTCGESASLLRLFCFSLTLRSPNLEVFATVNASRAVHVSRLPNNEQIFQCLSYPRTKCVAVVDLGMLCQQDATWQGGMQLMMPCSTHRSSVSGSFSDEWLPKPNDLQTWLCINSYIYVSPLSQVVKAPSVERQVQDDMVRRAPHSSAASEMCSLHLHVYQSCCPMQKNVQLQSTSMSHNGGGGIPA